VSNKKVAFVLGNGTSRKIINPFDLKQHGKIYGCNALFRTFAPDYLVAVDTKMIMEIQKTNYQHKHEVWSNPNKLTKQDPNINKFNPNKGWSSGPTALHMASMHDNAEIYILGFDYVGLGKDNELVNNIYSGTQNYKNINDRATYYGNWQRQTMACINQFVRTKYIRVTENEESYIPDTLKDCKNLKHITIDSFIDFFGITPLKS
tara:strand:+ start:1093 stop:1707 length:615 start_codon:yes stop_codon:yes gene_type:complete